MTKKAISILVTYDDGTTFEWKGVDAMRMTSELAKAYERTFYSNNIQESLASGGF